MRVILYEPSRYGGLKAYTDGLAGGLARNGAKVSLLTRYEEPQIFKDYETIAQLRDPRRPVGRFFWAFDRLAASAFNSLKLVFTASSGYDICHLQIIQPLFDWSTLRMIRIPVVLTVHDVLPHAARWWERRSLYHLAYRAADRIIVHSRHNAEVLIETADIDPAKVCVIPHGLEPIACEVAVIGRADARRRLELPLEAPIALAFGGIRNDKGLDLALQALNLTDDWLLVVAGESYGHSEYLRLAESLGVEGRVYWHVGFVPDELVPLYFVAADIVVLPYKPSFESQSGILFQAYRYHKPVVATDVGGLGEAVREDKSGIVVPPDDPQAFADGMIEVLRINPGIEWSLIEHKYSWDSIAKTTLGVYQQTLVDCKVKK